MASSPQVRASSASSTLAASGRRRDLCSREGERRPTPSFPSAPAAGESGVRRGRVSGREDPSESRLSPQQEASVTALCPQAGNPLLLPAAPLPPAPAPAPPQVQRPSQVRTHRGLRRGRGLPRRAVRGPGGGCAAALPAALGWAAPAAPPPADRRPKFQPPPLLPLLLPPPHTAVPTSPISFLPALPLAAAMTARSPRSACAGRARAGPARGAGAAGCASAGGTGERRCHRLKKTQLPLPLLVRDAPDHSSPLWPPLDPLQ
ncbi:classical arabinogalactan protein 9-like [Neopelma chrysocephalum]|uniref:classical arabinogalactan protein 9-like n=1 Tax=Neopelma chrysocephalum TaxID=114329 RepID=UPI000FCD4455|nr:classical arabinogalactan protein 9-like [Neopelma chrysocephalum]